MPHWGTISPLEFIETTGFSAIREKYFSDTAFHLLQLFLTANPAAGDIIPGSGGVRKLRWGTDGKGKRGGLRVIYYRMGRSQQILLITAYRKNEAGDLSKAALRQIRKLVKGL